MRREDLSTTPVLLEISGANEKQKRAYEKEQKAFVKDMAKAEAAWKKQVAKSSGLPSAISSFLDKHHSSRHADVKHTKKAIIDAVVKESKKLESGEISLTDLLRFIVEKRKQLEGYSIGSVKLAVSLSKLHHYLHLIAQSVGAEIIRQERQEAAGASSDSIKTVRAATAADGASASTDMMATAIARETTSATTSGASEVAARAVADGGASSSRRGSFIERTKNKVLRRRSSSRLSVDSTAEAASKSTTAPTTTASTTATVETVATQEAHPEPTPTVHETETSTEKLARALGLLKEFLKNENTLGFAKSNSTGIKKMTKALHSFDRDYPASAILKAVAIRSIVQERLASSVTRRSQLRFGLFGIMRGRHENVHELYEMLNTEIDPNLMGEARAAALFTVFDNALALIRIKNASGESFSHTGRPSRLVAQPSSAGSATEHQNPVFGTG